ncbi:MAG: hypothetical protein NTV51_27180 [Verrucomicrobia bacterium]|nr:hypothetical protein [Verrucomicrobiota bacterium]
MSEQHPPAVFAAVLTDPAHPLIVGGQAVNLWAEIYSSTEPELGQFEPFTSKDADIHGDRALAEILYRRSGWCCRFFDEPRQPAVAILTKSNAATTTELKIEVLRSVYGLNHDDLSRNQVREMRPGELYRLPDPFVMLKAKLANVAQLSVEKRPQDLKHVRMLIPISRAYFLEMHAAIGRPDMSERNFLGAVAYATEIVTSTHGRTVSQRHGLDLLAIFPASLADSPHEKIRRFAVHQRPRLTGLG